MGNTEWALIIFTILSQAAVGSFALITIFRQKNKDSAVIEAYRNASLVIVFVEFIALIGSLFHLGKPLLAFNSLLNIGSSWLSREIFFSGGFFVLLIAGILLDRKSLSGNVNKVDEKTVAELAVSIEKGLSLIAIINWLAVTFGALAVISMATVYGTNMIPAWQGWGTYVMFIGTTMVLGAALAGGLIFFFSSDLNIAGNLKVIFWVFVATIGIQMITYPAYLVSLQISGKAAQATLTLLADHLSIILIVRWALILIGGLLPLLLIWKRVDSEKRLASLIYCTLFFTFFGELLGKYLFYVTGVPITIGMF